MSVSINDDKQELLIKVKALEEELQKAESLNKNLLRIARERANAARGIRPKKETDGYIVLSCRQWTEKYKAEKPEPGYEDRDWEWLRNNGRLMVEIRHAKTWKTTLQTPYDAGLPLHDIESQIWNDLSSYNVLKELSCEEIVKELSSEMFEEEYPNRIYRAIFSANFRSGLWEVEIYTTASVTVPEHRRITMRRQRH